MLADRGYMYEPPPPPPPPPRRKSWYEVHWKLLLFGAALLFPSLVAAGLAILLVIVAVGWFIVWLAGWRVY